MICALYYTSVISLQKFVHISKLSPPSWMDDLAHITMWYTTNCPIPSYSKSSQKRREYDKYRICHYQKEIRGYRRLIWCLERVALKVRRGNGAVYLYRILVSSYKWIIRCRRAWYAFVSVSTLRLYPRLWPATICTYLLLPARFRHVTPTKPDRIFHLAPPHLRRSCATE